MKKLLALLVLVLILSGCSNGNSGSEEPTPTADPGQEVEEGNKESLFKVGTASITSISTSDIEDGAGSVQFTTTYAGVVTDADGVIKFVQFDAAMNTVKVDGDGVFEEKTEAPTKKELGDGYGMVKASSIGKEWYEQIAALEEYLIGKTIDEAINMELDGGKAADEDLLSGCTISINGYLEVLSKAYENAAEVEGVVSAALGSDTSFSLTDLAEGKGSAEADTTIAFAAVDAVGKLVYVSFDVAQNSVSLDKEGKWTAAESTPTKKEKGDNYGMIKASSIGKEWYEQIAAFEAALEGLSYDEALSFALEGGKAADEDVLSSCTISLGGYLTALNQAKTNLDDLK